MNIAKIKIHKNGELSSEVKEEIGNQKESNLENINNNVNTIRLNSNKNIKIKIDADKINDPSYKDLHYENIDEEDW